MLSTASNTTPPLCINVRFHALQIDKSEEPAQEPVTLSSTLKVEGQIWNLAASEKHNTQGRLSVNHAPREAKRTRRFDPHQLSHSFMLVLRPNYSVYFLQLKWLRARGSGNGHRRNHLLTRVLVRTCCVCTYVNSNINLLHKRGWLA